MATATSGKELLAQFFDEGAYQVLGAGGEDAVITAFGSAGEAPVYAVCQTGAAMTAKDLEKIVKALELAAKTGNPVVTFYHSAGAKLEEGLSVLRGSARWLEAVSRLSGVVPQIAVVTGVCGATSALAAAGADVCIVTRDARLFLTAPAVSAAPEEGQPGAGTAEYAAGAGVAAIVAEDAAEAAAKAAELVGMLPANNLAGPALFEPQAAQGKYVLAKYSAHDALASVADEGSILELFTGFGRRAVTALAAVEGSVAGMVVTENEPLCGECASKIARFVRLCDAFSIPVVTVINTPGFEKNSADHLTGGLRAAARLAGTYADATTAKVAVVTGTAVGPAYASLACADLVIAAEGCTIAPVEPSAAVMVLEKEEIEAGGNVAAAVQAKAARYAAEQCSAQAAVQAGAADFAVSQDELRGTLAACLEMLSAKRTQRLPKKHGNLSL